MRKFCCDRSFNSSITNERVTLRPTQRETRYSSHSQPFSCLICDKASTPAKECIFTDHIFNPHFLPHFLLFFTGPAHGTCATTCTPGPNHIKNMIQSTDAFPLNFGFTGKSSGVNLLNTQVETFHELVNYSCPRCS